MCSESEAIQSVEAALAFVNITNALLSNIGFRFSEDGLLVDL